MKKARLRVSEWILIAVVAAPFLWLIFAAISTVREDRALAEDVALRYEPVTCVVVESGYRALSRLEPVTPGSTRKREVVHGYEPLIDYRYEWRGQSYRSRRFAPQARTFSETEAQAFTQTYRVDSQHQCRVDPDDPSRAVIAR